MRLRPLAPDDREGLRQAFERLSPESRYRRFLHHIEQLADEDLDNLMSVDGHDHVAWVAYPEGDVERGVGIARYVRDAAHPEAAEAAITIADAWQRRGLGRILLEQLAETAIANGVRVFTAVALADNRAVISLLRSLGVTHSHFEEGVVRMEVELPATVAELRGTPAPGLLRAAAAGQIKVRPLLEALRRRLGKSG